MLRAEQMATDPGAGALLGRFEEFRRESAGGRRRLPEALWLSAVELARRQGVWPTARLLRLSATDLKRRLEGVGRRAMIKTDGKPAFVELRAATTGVSAGFVIELESRRGTRLTIRGVDVGGLDVSALTDVFLKQCR